MTEDKLIFNQNALARISSLGIINRENMESYIELAKELYTPNKKIFKKTIRPEFDTKAEQKAWEFEEIRKCIHGTKHICGKMYFYLNYCTIKTMKGYALPEFRTSDNAWFQLITESTRHYNGCLLGRPLLALKRRRSGYSTKAACDSLHDSIFFPASETGMVSKSERDGEVLLRKVKEMWVNLPEFLKYPLDGQVTKSHLEFAREIETDNGKELTGNMSILNSVAPVPTAFEGRLLTKFIFDEIGKSSSGVELFNMTYDCLTDSGELVGQICLFGTAGNIDKEGRALLEFWNDHDNEAYNFYRFFVPAFTGIRVDKYGNDSDIRTIVEGIINKREKMEKRGGRSYFDYLQKHPLSPQEALLSNKASGIGNILNINKQINELNQNPIDGTKGYFKKLESANSGVMFVPDPFGKCVIYEQPSEGILYSGGVDNTDTDNTSARSSDQASYFMKPAIRTNPPKVVFEYVDKPDKVEVYYEQLIMACLYFNECKPLIESNRYGMIKYFELSGYQHLLKKEPQPKNTVKRTYTPKIGIRKTTITGDILIECVEEYTDNYCDTIPSVELLNELLEYGDKNTDRAVAFGWCLVSYDDDLMLKKQMSNRKKKKLVLNKLGFKKVNGKLVRNS